MIYNTSGPLNPTTHKQIILERKELNKSLDLIKTTDNYVAISGPRQFGKTTLLYQIGHKLPTNKFKVSYTDLENTGDYDKSQFYNIISRKILDELENSLENTDKKYPVNKIIDQDKFIEFLMFISRYSKAQKLVFLIDEIGGMPKELAWKSFLPSLRWIFNTGRGNGKDGKLCNRIRFVFAGSTDLLHYVGHNSPINNVCEKIEIKEFDDTQVHQLTKRLETLREEQHAEISKFIYEWTGGHPYLTQKLLMTVEENITNNSNKKPLQTLNDLIESEILSGIDKNISHVIKTLEIKPEYMPILYPIYKGENKKDVKYKEELITAGLLKIDNETHFLMPRNKIYFHTINSLLDINIVKLQNNSSIHSRLLVASVNTILLPKYLGEFALETFGRSNPSQATKVIWGYILIFIFFLIVFGFIDIDLLIKYFIDFWRFFFPVK